MKRFLTFCTMWICLSAFATAQNTEAVLKSIVEAQEQQIARDDAEWAEEERIMNQQRPARLIQRINEAATTYRNAAATLEQKGSGYATALASIERIESLKQRIVSLSKSAPNSPEVNALKEELEDAYKTLEKATYTTTSFETPLTLRVSPYDRSKKTWRGTIYSSFFNSITLFNTTFELSYEELSGTKEGEQVFGDIMLYDSLFRQIVPVVYVRLTYKILRWKNASEYGFLPSRCEIVRSDTNKVIAWLDKEAFYQETFITYPQIDIRNKEEIDSDMERLERMQDKEKSTESTKWDLPFFGLQKGRTALYVSVDTMQTKEELNNFDIKNITFNSANISADFGIKQFGFLGGMFGYTYKGSRKRADYSFGVVGGFNAHITSYVRPYIETGVSIRTDNTVSAALGSGIDVIFGKLMVNAAYHYNWSYTYDRITNLQNTDMEDFLRYHTFAVGVGITW